MSTIEDVIDQIIQSKIKEGFIPCTDKPNQESIRVMAFNVKNKLPEMLKNKLAISKFNLNGKFYVKVYEKPNTGFLIMSEEGELIPGKKEWTLDKDKALQRQIRLMREDGINENVIKETIEEAKNTDLEEVSIKELKIENPEFRGVDSKPETILSEKEEMKRMKEE